jgi:putative phosphoribosyl transferase
MWRDRKQAGEMLATQLLPYKKNNPIVISLIKGGVPIGYEIARELRSPLDFIIVRKLGFPHQPEFAIGAIAFDGCESEIVINKELDDKKKIIQEHVQLESMKKMDEIKNLERLFHKHRPHVKSEGQTVIVTDDGIATGTTMRTALYLIARGKPKRVIVATPVSSPEAIGWLKEEGFDVESLITPQYFQAVGSFYEEFNPVENEEVIHYLDLANENYRINRKVV